MPHLPFGFIKPLEKQTSYVCLKHRHCVLLIRHVSKTAQWTKLASPSQECSVSFKSVNEFSSNCEKFVGVKGQ